MDQVIFSSTPILRLCAHVNLQHYDTSHRSVCALPSGVTQDEAVSSAFDNMVCKSKKHLVESDSGSLGQKVGPIQNLELVSGSMLTSIVIRPDHSLLIRPYRTQKIKLFVSMSAVPCHPRDWP